MNIRVETTSKMQTNTYIIEGKDGIIMIDPGDDALRLHECVKLSKKRLYAILLTHAHFDHIGAVADLLEAQKGEGNIPVVFVHKDDEELISTRKNLGVYMGVKVKPFIPDILLAGGEVLQICGFSVKVLHTPGHTQGGVCYVFASPSTASSEGKQDKVMFSGDTLFKLGYGRTDLFGGDFGKLKNAIVNKLFRLPDDMPVYPGHGDATALFYEKKFNPILLADDPHLSIVD